MTTRTETPEAPFETRRAHLHLAREAGYGRISTFSVAAGVFAALGVVTVAVAIAAMVLAAAGVDTTSMSNDEWKQAGTVAAVLGVVVFGAAWWFGGYVAGRMARRAGAAHGALVAAWGAALLAFAALVAWAQDAGTVVANRLERLGAPTTAEEWAGIVGIAGAVALLAMFTAAASGGHRGERWHQRLVARAFDPQIGPEAALRADAQRLDERARRLAAERVDGTSDSDAPAEPGPVEPGPAAPGGEAPDAGDPRGEEEEDASAVTILPAEAEVDARRVTPA